MKLNVPARAIAFLAPFVAKGDIRHYLCGIYVRPMTIDEGGGVLLAATNGRIAGLWRQYHNDPVCERPTLLKVTPGLVSACRANTDQRRVTLLNDRLTVVEDYKDQTREAFIQPATDWTPECKDAPWEIRGAHTAKYPDMMRVVPVEKDRGPTGKLNAEYLIAVSQAFKAAAGPKGRRWGTGLHLRQVERQQANLVVCEDMPEAAAVIMPMRDSNLVGGPVPKWIDQAKAAWDRNHRAHEAPLPVHEPSDAGPPDGDGRGWSIVRGQA